MNQEPAQQDPLPTEPTQGDIDTAHRVINSARNLPAGTTELPPATMDMISRIAEPELQTQVHAYANQVRQWGSYNALLDDTLANTQNKELHDFMAQPQQAIPAAVQDTGKVAAKFFKPIGDVVNFAERQVGMRETNFGDVLIDAAGGVAGALPWADKEMTREIFGYDGSSHDFWLEGMAGKLVEETLWNDFDGGSANRDLLDSIPDKEKRALALDRVMRQMDKEAEDMGFWDSALYAGKVYPPQIAAFLLGPGVAGPKMAAGAGRVGNFIRQWAPGLAKVIGIGSRTLATGVAVASFEGGRALTPLQKDFLHHSENPEEAEYLLRTSQLVTGTLMWPLYEGLGHVGNKVTKMLGGNPDALIGHSTSTFRRMGAGAAGHGVTGLGFSTAVPLAQAGTTGEGREFLWDMVASAYAGDMDLHEIMQYAGESFGGAIAPFAAMGAIMHMRAMPGISQDSRAMIDRMSKQIIKEAPPELREALMVHQVDALDQATRSLSSLLEKDLRSVMEGKGSAFGGDKRADDVAWLRSVRPELTLEEAATHVENARRLLENRSPSTKEETHLNELIEQSKPLADEIKGAAEGGHLKLENWTKSDVGHNIEVAYRSIFLRRLWAKRLAFDSVVKEKAPDLAGGPERAPAAAEPVAAPSNPEGPKYPPRLSPGTAATRGAKDIAAWQESSKGVPAATDLVRQHINDPAARKSAADAVAAVLGEEETNALGPTNMAVVEQWDDLVESPEWDVTAANIVAYFSGAHVDELPNDDAVRDMSAAAMEMVKEQANAFGQPVGTTPATNQAQILRRVISALGARGGRSGLLAEAMLDGNHEYIASAFAQEKKDAAAKPEKRSGAPFNSDKRLDVMQKYRDATAQIAKGAVESLAAYARAQTEQRTGQPPADPTTANKPEGAEPPTAPETTEDVDPNITETPANTTPSDSELITDDMVGGANRGEGAIEMGGAKLHRMDLMEGMEPMYVGTILISEIKTHPDLQPRDSRSERRVDETRVKGYVDTFNKDSVNPGKFAWLEKDGVEGWYLLDGHHTLATLSDVGWEGMPGTFLRDVDWEQAVAISKTANSKRAQLKTIETAKAVNGMMDTGRYKTMAELGAEWSKPAKWAQQMVDIANLPGDIHSMAATGNLGKNDEDIRKTLAKLGEAHRMYPDEINGMTLPRIARKISQHKWYAKQEKVADFLRLYRQVTTAEQARAAAEPEDGSMLFPEMQLTNDAIEIIAEITDARAVVRKKKNETAKVRARLDEWSKTSSPAERESLQLAVQKAQREETAANERVRFLDLVKERVLTGQTTGADATAAAKLTDAAEIQAFLEDINRPPSAPEPTQDEEPNHDLFNPPVEPDSTSTEGSDGTGPIEVRAPSDVPVGGSGSNGAGGSGNGGAGGSRESRSVGATEGVTWVNDEPTVATEADLATAKAWSSKLGVITKELQGEILTLSNRLGEAESESAEWKEIQGKIQKKSALFIRRENDIDNLEEAIQSYETAQPKSDVGLAEGVTWTSKGAMIISEGDLALAESALKKETEDLGATQSRALTLSNKIATTKDPAAIAKLEAEQNLESSAIAAHWHKIKDLRKAIESYGAAGIEGMDGVVRRGMDERGNGIWWGEGENPGFLTEKDYLLGEARADDLYERWHAVERALEERRGKISSMGSSPAQKEYLARPEIKAMSDEQEDLAWALDTYEEVGLLGKAQKPEPIPIPAKQKPAWAQGKKRVDENDPPKNTWVKNQKPAGEKVTALQEEPPKEEGFKTWGKEGKDAVFSNRKAAITQAQKLAEESPGAEYIVWPVNPKKPTGRSKVGWRARVKEILDDFMKRVTDRPDFKDAMKRLKGEKEDPNAPDVDNLYSGFDPEKIGAAFDVGKIIFEEGLRDIKAWGGFMKEHAPKEGRVYFKEMWNALVSQPGADHLQTWTDATSAELGLPVRASKPTSKAAKEYPGAFRTPKAPSVDFIDHSEDRLTIDDQIAGVRKEQLDRARGLRGEDQSFLLDAFVGSVPEITQKIEHPVRGDLKDHQKYMGDVYVTALTDGGKDSVLDSSGPGTGKTWTGMAVALEMQRRNGGKIVLTTSNNAAIESWRLNDFNGMGIDPSRVGYLKDINDPDKDIILASYYNYQTRKSAFSDERIGKLEDLDEAIANGVVKTMIWDEAHRAGTWYKGTNEAQRVVQRMDNAWDVGIKQIFSTATPFDDPKGMRWMEPLGIWGKDFRSFLDKLGYTTTSKGKDGGFTVTPPSEEAMPTVFLKLIRLRESLAEQGQQVGWDLSGEGVENVFMKMDYSKEDGDNYWAVARSYKFLADALEAAGMQTLSTMAGAWRVNHAKRIVEDIAAKSAVRFGLSAVAQGGRFLFLSSYRSPKKKGSILRILEKKRGENEMSALDEIAAQQGPQVAAQVLSEAMMMDEAMGSQPPILDYMDKAFRAAGLKGMKVSGALRDAKDRVAVLEQWKDETQDLDYLIGTRATLGESISAQDTYGRQIFQAIASPPWTGREVVQEMGRAHRIGEVTKPVIAWFVADEFPSSVANVERVAARLMMVRAGVQGMQSDPTNLENAKDMAAFFMSAKDSERLIMRQVLDLENRIMESQDTGSAGPIMPPKGVDIVENDDFFGDGAETMRVAPESKAPDDLDIPPLTAQDFGSFEEWKADAAHVVETLFADLEMEAASDPQSPMPASLEDLGHRSAAMRDLSKIFMSRDIVGAESEARDYVNALLAGRLPSTAEAGVELPTEGLKPMKGAKGKQSGALDLRILAAPVKLAQFAVKVGYNTLAPDPLHYARPAEATNLRIGKNNVTRAIKTMFSDATNIWGYRFTEPYLETTRDYNSMLDNIYNTYRPLRKAVIKKYGWNFFENEGAQISFALNGERYDSTLGPVEGRLGRIEEYQEGAREWTMEIKEAAQAAGFDTAEAWLEAQPTYKSLMFSEATDSSVREYYKFSRNILDTLWKMHLTNNKDFQYWLKAKAQSGEALRAGNLEGKDLARAKNTYAKATKKVANYFDDKGIEDYFSHYFPEKRGRRKVGPWLKQTAGNHVYNEMVSKGRVSHTTGWLQNVEKVILTYVPGMVRKVYMDRAANITEGMIEGEWGRLNANTLLPKEKAGSDYTRPGTQTKGGILVESLTFAKQKKVKERGEIMELEHTRVRYEGRIYDAELNAKSPSGNLRGLMLRPVKGKGDISGDAGGSLFFTRSEAAGIYLEAKVGGLRQKGGDKTEVLAHMEKWMERIMGMREYTLMDKAIDTHTNFFYRTTLGMLNVKIAQTNLMGGMGMLIGRLGPIAVAQGSVAMVAPGAKGQALRAALKHSGIFSQAALAYQQQLVGTYKHSGTGASGQLRESIRLASAKLVKVADTLHMAPFQASEAYLRITAFASGYSAAKRAGWSEEDSRLQGLRAVGDTQMWYDSANSSMSSWSAAGRAIMQFSTYGVKAMNLYGLNVGQGWRGIKDSIGGYTAREGDVKSAATAIRLAAIPFLITQAYNVGTESFMNNVLNDGAADNRGMDASYVWGMKVRDTYAADAWWRPLAYSLKQKTGIDIEDAFIPGLMLPYGASMPVQGFTNLVNFLLDSAKSDPKAWERMSYANQKIYIPAQIRRFMQIQDVGGENSDLDKKVEALQERLRGFQFAGITPLDAVPNYKDYRKLNKAIDVQRAFVMEDGAGNEWYSASGPMTQAAFWLTGTDHRVLDQIEAGKEMRFKADMKKAQKEYVRDAYKGLWLENQEGFLPSEAWDTQLDAIKAYAKEHQIKMGFKTQERWADEAREIKYPSAERLKNTSVDEIQTWDFLVDAGTNGSMTFSAWLDTYKTLKNVRSDAFVEWSKIPGNYERLNDAWKGMEAKEAEYYSNEQSPDRPK
jgi:hypothetical protein